MNINDVQAILQKLKNTKISQSEIARALKKDRGNINAKAKRGTELKLTEINQLEQYFNVDLTNKSFLQKNVNILTTNLQQNVLSSAEIEADYYPDVFGSCGGGVFTLSEIKEKITIPEKCFFKPISKVKTYSVINAYGDSMAPTIFDKDRLIVEHFEYGEQIFDKRIYVFCYEDQIYVKRLIKNIDEYVIKSDNPDPIYKPRFIQKEEMNNLHIIGQIVGLMRDLR